MIGNLQCAGSSDYRAVVWDAGGFHLLGSLGGRNSHAFGISRDGATILGMADNGEIAADGQFVTRPVRWTNGAIVALDTLGGTFGAATFHTLRHTYATWLAQSQVHPFVAMRLVRHRSVGQTERYSHTTEAEARQAVNVLALRRPA